MIEPSQVLPHRQELTQPFHPPGAPDLKCPATDYRPWTTWNEIGEAMRHAAKVHLRQSWRALPEDGFLPGAISIAHARGELIVHAELSDRHIFNPIHENEVPAYPSGDVFEIFLRAADEENYFEHHITPDNCTFQLRFPSSAVFRAIKKDAGTDWFREFAGTIPVSSKVLVQHDRSLWRVLAVVPLQDLTSRRSQLPARWRFSFCRYDYIPGKESPVLSSTSNYPKPDFHDLEAWGTFTLDDEQLTQGSAA